MDHGCKESSNVVVVQYSLRILLLGMGLERSDASECSCRQCFIVQRKFCDLSDLGLQRNPMLGRGIDEGVVPEVGIWLH